MSGWLLFGTSVTAVESALSSVPSIVWFGNEWVTTRTRTPAGSLSGGGAGGPGGACARATGTAAAKTTTARARHCGFIGPSTIRSQE